MADFNNPKNWDELLAEASAWLAQDPDVETRAELAAVIAANDEAGLASRFNTRLDFGTAGLRGELGAGTNRMNRVLVCQTAAGIANFLRNVWPERHDTSQLSVVIGYDGRIKSDVFAQDSAQILAAAGIKVYLFDSMCPTPLVAYAVKKLGCSAGIMVTASHNPPRDNGYKVYLGGSNGGSQIVSPTDQVIAAEILAVAANQTFAELPKSNDFEFVGAELFADYIEHTAKLVGTSGVGVKDLKIVYTAMHGVGWATAKPLFDLAGFGPLIGVDEQVEPDGLFPTVAFPNPEEPGALDLSFAKANSAGADFIIANDPDADRLAIAIPDSSNSVGWRRLTGDEVGLILADELARLAAQAGTKGNLATSIVSSSALSKVAARYGFGYRETLTGFKWVAKVPDLIFGYEEALGYCVDCAAVPDKDGISSALVFAALAARLAAEGKSVEAHLNDLGEAYGFYATGQISIRVTDLTIIGKTIERLRNDPPTTIAGVQARFTDLAKGTAELQPTDGLRFDLADGRRVIIRPSGTEPKLKCYLLSVGDSKPLASESLQKLETAMRGHLGL
jgi:phosphomannomutase